MKLTYWIEYSREYDGWLCQGAVIGLQSRDTPDWWEPIYDSYEVTYESDPQGNLYVVTYGGIRGVWRGGNISDFLPVCLDGFGLFNEGETVTRTVMA